MSRLYRIDARAFRRWIELTNGRPMTSQQRAVLARLLVNACRGPFHADTVACMTASDDRSNPLSMNAPVPTGRTPGERQFLSDWGKALEKVAKKRGDLPGIRRGRRLQEANAEREESES